MALPARVELSELLRHPREELDIEIKDWLDPQDANQRADLVKALIALANNDGGYLIIGLAEQGDGRFVPVPGTPAQMAALVPDAIQDAIQKYSDPPFQCRTQHVLHPDTGTQFPIIVVPGGHRVPIKAKAGSPDAKLIAGKCYIRRPGPRSEEPQTAAEWDQLLERCVRARKDELLYGMRDLLAGEVPRVASREQGIGERLDTFISSCQRRWAELTKDLPADSSPQLPHGFYEVGFAIDGAFAAPSLSEFRDLLRQSLRNHSGWPPFVIIDRDPYRPRPVDGAIETWIGPEVDGATESPDHCDFWRMTPSGLFYTRRGLSEDGRLFKGTAPGTILDITSPTWRIGETVLQAHYIATALGATDANLVAKFRWQGLAGRQLASVGGNRLLSPIKRVAHQNEFSTEVTMAVERVPTALPEIVFNILAPLYQLFDFFPLPKRLVEEELAQLRRHNF